MGKYFISEFSYSILPLYTKNTEGGGGNVQEVVEVFSRTKAVFAVPGGNFSKKKILRFWKSLKYVKEWPEDVGPSQF